MIHALACPAAAPRPTAAVVELREPHCALRPATEIGSGRARLTPSLGPLGLPPRAGSLAWLRRFLGATAKQLVAGLQANSLLIAQRWAGRPSHMASWLLCWWTGKPACQALGCALRSSNSKAPAVRPEAMDDFAAIRNRQVLDRATPVTTTAHTRDPFAPHLFVRAWRQRSPHHGHPQRLPSRSLRPLTSRLISVQPVLGSELQSGLSAALRCTGCLFFVRAQGGCGVAWRGVLRAPKPLWA